MEYGPAACEWARQGGAIRRVRGLGKPEMVMLPHGGALALIDADLTPEDEEATFEILFGRLWLAVYGNPDARKRLRAWMQGHPAA